MNPMKKAAVGAVLAASALTGGAIGAAFLSGGTASAQTSTDGSTSSSDSSATAPAPAPRDPKLGGHTANGITESLLTGDAATSATAAAQAAVPDGTVDRVENDAEGAVYEAHVTKADGSRVTVKMDASFNVTGIETGR
ncbi:MAG: hypothetical protein QOI95_3297 [Acidimicrobiaceae bacterium]|jgi:uncharacterized membrane protein YkoI